MYINSILAIVFINSVIGSRPINGEQEPGEWIRPLLPVDRDGGIPNDDSDWDIPNGDRSRHVSSGDRDWVIPAHDGDPDRRRPPHHHPHRHHSRHHHHPHRHHSRRHHHHHRTSDRHKLRDHHRSHEECDWKPVKKCCTKTITTTINETPCCLLVYPNPTNPTVHVTITTTVLPTIVPTVAPAVEHKAHFPCTDYTTVVVDPEVVCTTMVFCDLLDQSADCVAHNDVLIHRIVERAFREGGRVYVNGELVTPGKVSSQSSNDANSLIGSMVGGAALLLSAFLFI